MIGFFKCDAKPDVKNSLILAHSSLNDDIKGYFYFREADCADVSSIDKGSEFFGVLDDSSGFGACLFVKDLDVETNAALMQHNLHVKGDATVDNVLTVEGKTDMRADARVFGNLLVSGDIKTYSTISGMSPNTMLSLTSAHCAMIIAAGLTGQPTPPGQIPLTGVDMFMQNT